MHDLLSKPKFVEMSALDDKSLITMKTPDQSAEDQPIAAKPDWRESWRFIAKSGT